MFGKEKFEKNSSFATFDNHVVLKNIFFTLVQRRLANFPVFSIANNKQANDEAEHSDDFLFFCHFVLSARKKNLLNIILFCQTASKFFERKNKKISAKLHHTKKLGLCFNLSFFVEFEIPF